MAGSAAEFMGKVIDKAKELGTKIKEIFTGGPESIASIVDPKGETPCDHWRKNVEENADKVKNALGEVAAAVFGTGAGVGGTRGIDISNFFNPSTGNRMNLTTTADRLISDAAKTMELIRNPIENLVEAIHEGQNGVLTLAQNEAFLAAAAQNAADKLEGLADSTLQLKGIKDAEIAVLLAQLNRGAAQGRGGLSAGEIAAILKGGRPTGPINSSAAFQAMFGAGAISGTNFDPTAGPLGSFVEFPDGEKISVIKVDGVFKTFGDHIGQTLGVEASFNE